MTVDQKITVLEAYRDGKQIQFKPKFSTLIDYKPEWQDCEILSSLNWNFQLYDYRVKPELTLDF